MGIWAAHNTARQLTHFLLPLFSLVQTRTDQQHQHQHSMQVGSHLQQPGGDQLHKQVLEMVRSWGMQDWYDWGLGSGETPACLGSSSSMQGTREEVGVVILE